MTGMRPRLFSGIFVGLLRLRWALCVATGAAGQVNCSLSDYRLVKRIELPFKVELAFEQLLWSEVDQVRICACCCGQRVE